MRELHFDVTGQLLRRNKQNISGINFDDYGHAENLYMFGFSKTGII